MTFSFSPKSPKGFGPAPRILGPSQNSFARKEGQGMILKKNLLTSVHFKNTLAEVFYDDN